MTDTDWQGVLQEDRYSPDYPYVLDRETLSLAARARKAVRSLREARGCTYLIWEEPNDTVRGSAMASCYAAAKAAGVRVRVITEGCAEGAFEVMLK